MNTHQKTNRSLPPECYWRIYAALLIFQSTAWTVVNDFNTGVFIVQAILMMLSLTSFLACLLISTVVRKWRFAKFGLALLLIVISGLVCGGLISNYQGQQMRKSLEETIECLETFYAQAGRYPESLKELEEEFGIKVPDGKLGIGLRSQGLEYSCDRQGGQRYSFRYDIGAWGYMRKENGGDWKYID